MSKLTITLIKSPNGCKKDQIATVAALGLRKINGQVVQEDNECIRGMVFKVKHLIKVEETKA
ncbi:MAG: 50S ribosomal protein L30 [Christensenellales bacterium]